MSVVKVCRFMCEGSTGEEEIGDVEGRRHDIPHKVYYCPQKISPFYRLTLLCHPGGSIWCGTCLWCHWGPSSSCALGSGCGEHEKGLSKQVPSHACASHANDDSVCCGLTAGSTSLQWLSTTAEVRGA